MCASSPVGPHAAPQQRSNQPPGARWLHRIAVAVTVCTTAPRPPVPAVPSLCGGAATGDGCHRRGFLAARAQLGRQCNGANDVGTNSRPHVAHVRAGGVGMSAHNRRQRSSVVSTSSSGISVCPSRCLAIGIRCIGVMVRGPCSRGATSKRDDHHLGWWWVGGGCGGFEGHYRFIPWRIFWGKTRNR